jgi:hypothetical protein
MEEFEKLVAESFQAELIPAEPTESAVALAVESNPSAEHESAESVPETEQAG